MINPKEFFKILKTNDISFFAGVPDSLLKNFCAYVTDNTNSSNHVITSNEGGAIALASGYHLATGKIALVYMQNSGLGNAINPLASLADPKVYSIPMLIMIGWRGEPGIKDEPQHEKQGEITPKLLKTMDIPFDILPTSFEAVKKIIKKASIHSKKHKTPYALLVKKGSFETYKLKKAVKNTCKLSREEAIKLITNALSPQDIVVATTGKAGRELFEHREGTNQGHEKDFLTVGSMGHTSQIAFGIALAKPKRRVYCLDGDGSAIMHMGHQAVIGKTAPRNLIHIILNNEAHDSVGEQPTAGNTINFPMIAKACGYKNVFSVKARVDLLKKLKQIKKTIGPVLLEVKINKGSRKDLGRPTKSPKENKKDFMNFLR